MENILILVIVSAVVVLAARYVRKTAKAGTGCVGCPHSGSCSGSCKGCGKN